MNCLTKPKPATAVPRTTRWLAAGLLISAVAIPGQVFAACSGAAGIFNNGTDITGNGYEDYLLNSLPTPVGFTIIPAAGPGSDPIDVDQVKFALTCADNGTFVPCTGGDDTLAGGTGTPITFTSLDGGTCGASVNAGLTTDSVVVFDLPDATLTQAGCTILVTTQLNGIGMDSDPELLTPAINFEGLCGSESGTAGGSDTIEVIDPAISIVKYVWDPSIPDWVDANDAPGPTYVVGETVSYQLEVCNIGDVDLDPVTVKDDDLIITETSIGALAVGECVTIDSGTLGFEDLDSELACAEPGPFENTAYTYGEVGNGTPPDVTDNDPANVICVEPDITVTKDGPPLSKVGDQITYTICATNTGGVDLTACTLDDTLLGPQGAFQAAAMPLTPAEQACDDYMYTVMAGDQDPLPNTATVTCDVVGSQGNVSDSNDHEVNLFQPEIAVTKTGDTEGKVGDEVCYDISFENLSSSDTPPLVNCVGNDNVIGPLGVFEAGVVKQFCREIDAGDPDPLVNTATIECELEDFDNGLPAPATDTHSVDLFEVGAALSKSCIPGDTTITVPDPISWEICVENTGEKAINCDITDPTADITTPVNVELDPGELDCSTTASRGTTSADVGTVTNTASAACMVPGYDNEIPTLTATDTCTVEEVGDEFCRTPGFWGTHAGEEKEGRSNNLTQAVIDAGGPLDICGQEITNTSFDAVGDTPSEFNSAVEAMCVHPKGEQQRQLARQLTAASLNCIVFGAGADCAGSSIAAEFAAANAACEANADDLSQHIEAIDDFNNSEDCHEAPFSDYEVFDQFDKVPGPAGSSRACSAAVKNETYVVPATQ